MEVPGQDHCMFPAGRMFILVGCHVPCYLKNEQEVGRPCIMLWQAGALAFKARTSQYGDI
jgi:hypothetical protein